MVCGKREIRHYRRQMTDSLKVGLAQLNPKVGDVAGNLAKVRAARETAAKQGADLVVCAEMVLSGYFPEDLVLKPAFQKRCHEAVEELRADTARGGPAILVTTPWREEDKLYNAIIALDKGEIIGKRYKVDLPNYGVFDDKRVFTPGPMPGRSSSTACASVCRSARTSGRPTSSSALPRPAVRSCWCPTARPMKWASSTCACSTA